MRQGSPHGGLLILLMTSLELHTNLSKCTSTRIPSPATFCRVKTNILLFSVCLCEKRHVAMERSVTDIVVGFRFPGQIPMRLAMQ